MIGLSDDKPGVAESVFDATARIPNSDKFGDTDWSDVTSELVDDFTTELVHG